MSTFNEPLSIIRAQDNLGVVPLQDDAAKGATSLDVEQSAVVLGEPIPIVFCRRVDGIGGVLVSPQATEAGYSNNAVTNELTVNLELVLSEGELPLLQIRDVFQRACRVGTWAQAYDARAGSWNLGNTITIVSGTTPWNCPVYCGTSGSYDNITTLSYTNTHADEDDTWSKQVHAFVREGLQVTRIIDSTYGPSNNFIDLALYLLNATNRVPSSLIDTAAMLTAAQFTDENGLRFDGVLRQSQNLEDWLFETSIGFLLRPSERNGKKILKPRLPINEDYTIKTTALTPVFAFTEEHIIPGSFEIDYVPLSDRIPTCFVVLWRQQPDDDIGIIRNTEVRFDGEALFGPYEQHDLSAFCTSEDHAVKVGTYYAARRKYITHSLRISVLPDAFNSTLEIGDIVRVQLRRETDSSEYALHDYFYEVDRINKNTGGVVDLDLTHFPIDEQNRSLVALQVSQAVGVGYTMPTGRANFDCDISGRRTDTNPITELVDPDPPAIPDPDNFEYNLPEVTVVSDTSSVQVGGETVPGTRNAITSVTGGSFPSGGVDNEDDPIEEDAPQITGMTGDEGQPVEGDTLTVTPGCPDSKVTWYRTPCAGGTREVLLEDYISGNNSSTYTVQSDDIDYDIQVEVQCPDPGEPSGYGTPQQSAITRCVYPNLAAYTHVRWEGTKTISNIGTTSVVSSWYEYNPFGGSMSYLTIGPMFGCAISPFPLENSPAFYGPKIGPIAWRASVRAYQQGSCSSGYLSLGGLGTNGNPSGCGGSIQPEITFGCSVDGSEYVIEGKWQFANVVGGEYVLGGSWNGVEGFGNFDP